MQKLSRLLAPLAVLLVVVACGGHKPTHHHSTVSAVHAQIAQACTPGESQMGCSVRAITPPAHRFAFGAPPSGLLFPDVYEGQGTVDWNAVKAWQAQHGWHATAIFKMGEYREDFQAQRNAQQTAALGFWRSGYWFVRNTGCGHEADQITFYAHQLGIVVVSLDLEVPEANGYGACLSPILRARGFIVVEYTSPGSNPGGVDTSDPLWIATFGSSFQCIWTCHPAAWQYTDGTFGAVTFVPGVGHDDVNVDFGITKLGAPPPDPYALYLKTRWHLRFGAIASEYNTVKAFDENHCRKPVRRAVCRSSYYHLRRLRDRTYFVATHQVVRGHWVALRRPRWSFPKDHPLGSRFAGISHRL